MKANKKTMEMTQTALLMAIIIVLALTPLGFVPIGPIRATTIHIPVIIGAILLGPKKGCFLGGVFGVMSVLVNTVTATPLSFVFSPLIPVFGSDKGSPLALVVAIVPRLLIGLTAGLIYQLFGTRNWSKTIGTVVSGFAGSMINTLLVMLFIYLFFGHSYAAAKGVAYEAYVISIAGLIGINGMLEAVVAAVVSTLISRPLMEVLRRL